VWFQIGWRIVRNQEAITGRTVYILKSNFVDVVGEATRHCAFAAKGNRNISLCVEARHWFFRSVGVERNLSYANVVIFFDSDL
jgi:hypothetical protein